MDLTVQGYFVKSLSPGTLQSYKSATHCYLAFCHNFGIAVAFPLSEVILGRFVAFLANKHLSYVTIHVYLSALHFTQIASGLPDPSLSSFPLLTIFYEAFVGRYLNTRGRSASQSIQIYFGA